MGSVTPIQSPAPERAVPTPRMRLCPGRDRLLLEVVQRRNDLVLEIGCGSARNLVQLARRHPEAHFCGLEASEAALEVASRRVRAAGLEDRIRLRQGIAEQLGGWHRFGLGAPFDAVFFSYSLSMTLHPTRAIEAAFDALRPGGRLLVVDYWDAAGWPSFVSSALLRRLSARGIRPGLANILGFDAREQALSVRSIARRYAFLAALDKPAVSSAAAWARQEPVQAAAPW